MLTRADHGIIIVCWLPTSEDGRDADVVGEEAAVHGAERAGAEGEQEHGQRLVAADERHHHQTDGRNVGRCRHTEQSVSFASDHLNVHVVTHVPSYPQPRKTYNMYLLACCFEFCC